MRATVALVLTALSTVSAFAQPPAPSAQDTVIVLQRVNSRYDLPGNLEAGLAEAFPAQTIVRKNEGLSNVMSRLYAIGDHSTGPAVNSMIDWIRERNNLSADLSLRSGQVLVVPDVPKLGFTKPGSDNPNDQVPKLSLDKRPLDDLGELARPDIDRTLSDVQRPGAAIVISILQLTAEQGAEALDKDPNLLIGSAPLTLKFLEQRANDTSILAVSDAEDIHTAATLSPQQHPVLLIFDDSWPSLLEEEVSRAYILSALRDLRSQLLMPPMKPFKPQCALGTKVTSWTESGQSHAAEISQSLSTFEAAAGANSPVEVVYMPLLADGPCAGEVIGQISEFHLISEHMADALGKRSVPSDISTGYHGLANKVVAKLDVATTNGKAKTDVEAIQALFEFARRHGEHLRQPVFVSMSWDFPLDRYEPIVPTEFGGLFVVAAGNEGQDDSGNVLPPVVQTKMQFAARSAHPGDMLAVMNVDGTGKLTCQSSLVDPAGSAFATSYFGSLTEDDCGTSFSTPRVAWLLALREAIRPPLPDLTDLSRRIRSDLVGDLNGPGPDAGVLRLNLGKLLQASHP
jgi:hypothetical protein